MSDKIPAIMGRSGLQEALPVMVVDEQGRSNQLQMSALGYRQIEIPVGEATIIGELPSGARIVLVKIEGAAVRYRDDGVAPTAAIGMPLSDGESMTYDAQMDGIQFIAQAEGAICNLAFYGDSNG